jgi:predicted AAA+ superfamily ATPase
MIARHITPRVLDALADTPVVFVQGPRQAGKTTLVRSIASHGHRAQYLTLDDAAVLAAARHDADGFVAGLPDRVILDEVQRVPDLFRAIKRSVDQRRDPGRFLLTGSAHATVVPQASESLVGRMEVLTLWPFSQGEIDGQPEGFVDACFAAGYVPRPSEGCRWPDVVDRILRGGYPEMLTRKRADRRCAWLGSYVTTMLDREVRELASIQGRSELPRLLRLAATRSMGLLNFASLARDAAMPQTTLQRYWALLEATFLVGVLPPWSANLGTRLVKAPKVLPGDSGLLCYLVGFDRARLLADDLAAGPVLEAFVAGELVKQTSWSRTHPALYHYRTHTQQEVDLVLEDTAGRLVGIEVKRTTSPASADFRGLRHLRERTGERFLRGLLLHTGSAAVQFGDDLWAVPVSALWEPPSADA